MEGCHQTPSETYRYIVVRTLCGVKTLMWRFLGVLFFFFLRFLSLISIVLNLLSYVTTQA